MIFKIFFTSFLTIVFVVCGKSIPVRELTDARAAIEAAEIMKADKFAPNPRAKSRKALRAAHEFLTEEKIEEATKKAIESLKFALRAQSIAAPHYARQSKNQAARRIQEADEALAAVLARDDFGAAQKLFREGNELLIKTKAMNSEKKNGVKHPLILKTYRRAINKFTAAISAAERAKNMALAQKEDLLDSLSGVEDLLRRAEHHGAKKRNMILYRRAKREYENAKTNIKAGRLKEGNSGIVRAEQLARELLNIILTREAREKLNKAEALIKNAHNNINKRYSKKKNDKKEVQLREILAAAREAVNSARKNLLARKFIDSGKDSVEAINLAEIIQEQLSTADGVEPVKRSISPSGTKEQKNLVKNRSYKIKNRKKKWGGWKKYTVKKRKPADSLWRIAGQKNHYGKPWKWKLIFRSNRKEIKNPDIIFPGQTLWIPPESYKGKSKPPVANE